MECLKCGFEMTTGYIPVSKQPLMWLPLDEKPPMTIFGKPKNGIKLSKIPAWTHIKVTSYYCKNCNIVITPVNKTLNQER